MRLDRDKTGKTHGTWNKIWVGTLQDLLWHFQGPHCTGKTWKMAQKVLCQGKCREFWNFAKTLEKTQGIWFPQVENSLILKIQDVCCEISDFFQSQFHVWNWRKFLKYAQGNFQLDRGKKLGKHRECVNRIRVGTLHFQTSTLLLTSSSEQLWVAQWVITNKAPRVECSECNDPNTRGEWPAEWVLVAGVSGEGRGPLNLTVLYQLEHDATWTSSLGGGGRGGGCHGGRGGGGGTDSFRVPTAQGKQGK